MSSIAPLTTGILRPLTKKISEDLFTSEVDKIDPLDLNPYLYFDADANVSASGGAVSTWYSQWYGTSGPSNGRTEYLTQGTANLQPQHDTDGYMTFDTVTDEKDKLALSAAVGQAGVLIVATSNGIFAYEVDADSIDEITALGFETGYFKALDLYAYVLLPATVSDTEIAGVIKYLEEVKGATRNPTGHIGEYFRARSDIVSFKFDALDFSGVTDISYTFPLMGSLTSFPQIDTSGVTNWFYAFLGNSALTSFPVLDTSSGTSISYAWYQCTGLTSFPVLDFSSATAVANTWRGCTSLTSFPVLDFPSATSFSAAWYQCTGLTSFSLCTFSTDGDDDIDFSQAWEGCTALESFPALNLSRGTNFTSAWKGCNDASFTSFPAVTFSTTGSDSINFTTAWQNCDKLTSFPDTINLSRGTNFTAAWFNCPALTSFPALDLSNATTCNSAWDYCIGLTSFPALDLSSSTVFTLSWYRCSGLTSFPSGIDVSSGTDFTGTWRSCSGLTSFPALDLSSGTNFNGTWMADTALVSFGACNMNASRYFGYAWNSCSALTTFPAGVFDDWAPTSVTNACFHQTWGDCNALTEQSVENILLSISASGVYPTSDATASGTKIANSEITIGGSNSNVNVDNLTPATRAACTALQSRGWVVVINGSVVSEYALSFDGTDDWVDLGSPSTGTGAKTLSMWIKPTTIANDDRILSNLDTGNYGIRFDGSDIEVWDAAAWNVLIASPAVGVWSHLAIVFDGSGNQQGFINGVAGGNVASAYNLARLGLGAKLVYLYGNHYEGEIDEVSIWDAALDADAVAAVYNSGSPINLNQNKGNYDDWTDNLVSWWRMGDSDSGAGNFVSDVIATDAEALHLPGVASNYASVPDAADLDGFGNFTLEMKGVTLPDWTPSADQGLMAKYHTTGNQRSYYFGLTTAGNLELVVSFDGSGAFTCSSTVATGLADGATADILVLRTSTLIRFYVNGAKIGDDVAVASTALHNSTDVLGIGGFNTGVLQPLLGSVQRARVWNSAVANKATPTETPVLDANFTLANKGVTSFTATSGQVVTINSTAIANPAAIRSATDGVLVNGPTFVVDNPPNYSNYSLSFDGGDDFVELGSQSGDLRLSGSDGTISAWIKMDDVSAGDDYARIVDKSDGSGAANGYTLIVYNDGKLHAYIDGVGTVVTSAGSITDATWHHVVWAWDGTNHTIYVDGILDTTAASTARPPSDTTGMRIGTWNHSTGREFQGLMDEVAIWNSALTSAQINDIYNGGVPAALTSLSPLGWWRLGENDSGAGTTITDQGSGTNDGTLTNSPTFSRSVPAEDATWNNRSMAFDGTDYITTTANDTLASKSYSFWAKSDETGDNAVFSHGGDLLWGQGGAFSFNNDTNRPLLYMNGSNFRYWDDNAAQDDDAWHHHVVYIEKDAITNCKWYVDGAVQNPGLTRDDEPMLSYTTGTRIGRGGTYYFEGKLDEFAIFDGELTPAQVLQIYNGGKPADLKEFSPDSWWRMGDDDDAGGTTIRDLGVVSGTELVSNGEFDSDSGWTGSETGWTFTGGKAVATAAGSGYTLQQTDSTTLVVGKSYRIKFTVSDYSAGSVRAQLGAAMVGPTITANGDYSMDVACTDITGHKLAIQSTSASTTLKIDNFSVKQPDLVLNGGFDSDTIWGKGTGWSISGGKATSDNSQTGSSSLIQSGVNFVHGALYEVTYDWSTASVGTVLPYLGAVTNNVWLAATGTGLVDYIRYTGATGAANFVFFTSADSDGTVDNISVRQVNGNPGTLVNTPTVSTDTP